MGAGRGFGVILDGEYGQSLVAEAGDGFVVEIDVGYFDLGRQTIFGNSEAVIVSRYLYLSGCQVFNRLIAAAVAKF